MRLDPFYLITGSVLMLERLLPCGVRLVQLRLKGCAQVGAEVARARDLCRRAGAQLVVNDHWQVALDLGCEAVHLGQEDLDHADLHALRRAGVGFGVSTHNHAELERGLALGAAYVALGPIWETLLKPMACGPQGVARLAEWRRRAGATPLVAIGGITPERLGTVFAHGADCAAVVTDIAQAADPEARTRTWVSACAGWRR